jgi:hypothetical protein
VVAVADLVRGVHACCRFEGEAHKQAVIGAYVVDGVGRGERVALYTRGGDVMRLMASALSEAHVARLTAAGQLVLGSAEEGYFGGGSFDAASQVAAFESLAESALHDGFEGLRVYADNGWMPAALDDPSAWLDYELRISRMIRGRRLIGLCGFDAGEPEVLPAALVDALHPVGVGPAETRPSQFHVAGGDGGITVAGELDYFCVEDLLRVLNATEPLIAEHGLSLSGVTFVDGAAADALLRFVHRSGVQVVATSGVVRRVWDLLDAATIRASS